MVAKLLGAGKSKLLAVTIAMIALIAIADWLIGNRASLGGLYIVPMVLGAIVMSPAEAIILSIICSALRSWFDIPSSPLEAMLRSVFAFLAYAGSALLVTALMRNRQLMLEHLTQVRKEQGLRRQAEEHLKTLVESSPAAIVTLDGQGSVLEANSAANRLFLFPADQSLCGRSIRSYLPVLADALEVHGEPDGLRTAAQGQGRRENGEIFQANTWFSSFAGSEGMRLAAIIVDSSEELRDREEEALRELMQWNRIGAAAVSHEVRNLCAAVSQVCTRIEARHKLGEEEDFERLTTLVAGLEKIASASLQARVPESLQATPLQQVLDDLRIVIEPDWREIDGVVEWNIPPRVPVVLADRHGLLRAFLNLVQNSHRAVHNCPVRQLVVALSVVDRKALVKFHDSGPGVASPEHLFEPFQPGADGTGLGLYVSRAIVRSYGGDLKYQSQADGSCFLIELQVLE